MTGNRFEQVYEVQDDAVTLWLRRQGERSIGTIHCPAALSGGRLTEDVESLELELIPAFRSAVRLANEIKAPIVVLDPDGLWLAEWGELYRDESPDL